MKRVINHKVVDEHGWTKYLLSRTMPDGRVISVTRTFFRDTRRRMAYVLIMARQELQGKTGINAHPWFDLLFKLPTIGVLVEGYYQGEHRMVMFTLDGWESETGKPEHPPSRWRNIPGGHHG